MSDGRYFGNWSSAEDVRKDYSSDGYGASLPDDFPTDAEILFAAYETPPYEGYSCVLFGRGGVLHEDRSSHCSCNGLEWGPTPTTWEALALRVKNDDRPVYDLADEAWEAFKRIVAENLAGRA